MFDVITIGAGTRDVFLKSPQFRPEIKNKKELKKLGIKSNEATCFGLGSKIGIEEPIMRTGGAAINAAITFARQGFKTAAFLKIGNDEAGRAIIDKLKSEKITSLAIIDKKIKTAYSTILLSPDSERTILTYRGAAETITEKEIPFNKLQSKWIYISPSKINFSLVKKIVDTAYANGALIAINPSAAMLSLGVTKLASILKKIDVLILNREEASYLTGIDYNDKNEIFKKLEKLAGGIFVMTDGPKGAWISDNKQIWKMKTFPSRKVIDKTGAGDAFGSGFIAGLMRRQNNIEDAARLASSNATAEVEEIGAGKGVLTKREFETDKRWKKLKINVVKIKH